MVEHKTKLPPCSYCEKGLPHGGGVIRSAIIYRFSPLGVNVEMPFCNYPMGRSSEEIVRSIIDANPDFRPLLILLKERIIDYLEMGYHHFAYC